MTGTEPTQPANLGDTFGPAALSGLLTRRAPAPGPAAAPAPAGSEPDAVPTEPGETTPDPDSTSHAVARPAAAPASARRRATRSPAAGGRRPRTDAPKADAPEAEPPAAEEQPGTDFTSQLSVYLAADALVAVRRARKETGRTNAEVAFAAIDATHHRLHDLVARRRAGGGRPDGSLFPVRRSSRPAAGAGRVVLWAMRATPAEVAVLDRLVDEAGAASRSELIASAIEAHLLSDPDQPDTGRPPR